MLSLQRPVDLPGAVACWSHGEGSEDSIATVHSPVQTHCDNYEPLDEEGFGRTWQVALSYPLSIIANLKSKQQSQPCQSSRRASSPQGEISSKAKLNFEDLPICMKWLLFSYLDSHTLCQCAMVCRSWYALTNDELLWKKRLAYDAPTWQVIGHQSHPSVFAEAASDLPHKDIYLRCHPQATKYFGASNATSSGLRFPFRFPNWFRKPTRVAMFGPGLDSLPVVRTLLFNDAAPFKPNGMTPGREGVGSGVCIRHKDHNINLMILYKATKAERTRSSNVEEINRLVTVAGGNGSLDANATGSQSTSVPIAELTQRVKDMCQSVDAFVCVVDNCHEIKESAVSLIHGIMAAGNGPSRERSIPLLVLSTVETAGQGQMSCVELADSLKLTRLSQPWRVQGMCLENVNPVVQPGLDWLLERCRQ